MNKVAKYKEIESKYKSGLYNISQIAKIYNLDRNDLSRYLRKKNIQVDYNAKYAIKAFKDTLKHLKEIKDKDLQIEVVNFLRFQEPELMNEFYVLMEITLNKISDKLQTTKSNKELLTLCSALKECGEALCNNFKMIKDIEK